MPVTIAIIAFTTLVYAFCAFGYYFGFDPRALSVIFGLNELFFAGFYHQIISAMFMHGSLEHLAMNMLSLYAFAYRLERVLGAVHFALLYLLGGILTNILSLSYLYINPDVNMVGASGAICVLLGFMAYFLPQMRNGLFAGLVLMSFAPMFLGAQIAWYAHLFGFGVGYVLGLLKAKFKG